MRRIELNSSFSHGVPRVDDQRVISGIIFVIRNGLLWRDALKDWRRISARYDQCAHTFFSAIALAAIVMLWRLSMSPEPASDWRVHYYVQDELDYCRRISHVLLNKSEACVRYGSFFNRRRV